MADNVAYIVLLAVGDIPPGLFEPSVLVIEEAISEPPRATVQVKLADVNAIDPSGLVRKFASVSIVRSDTGEVVRTFTGLVTRVAERLDGRAEFQRFVITIESMLHIAQRASDYRVHLAKSTKEIVTEVLGRSGIEASGTSWKLTGSYQPREVCTQWGETLFDFASRLLEDDGVFYFFDYGDAPKLVLGDSSGAFLPITGVGEVTLQSGAGLLGDETINSLSFVERVRPAKVTLRDHLFKKPSLDLTASATNETVLAREHYSYPGGYETPAAGKAKARALADSFNASASLVRGSGQVFRLAAGHTFKITDGPSWVDGVSWVCRRVSHSWTQTSKAHSYRTDFEIFDSTKPFRPPVVTPKPRVYGPHAATVTGPAGEEIHCDEHGRIRVQFAWDRYGKMDDKSSGWVRAGQLHTSGSVVIPRIGWEMLVEFEDGDPDRPIAVSRVYNGSVMPPAALPATKTGSHLTSYSSPGGSGSNEIKMDDGAGSEVVEVRAEKDMNLNVANNKEEKVTTNASHSVGANHTMTVGATQLVQVGADDSLTVGGAQKYSVGAARTKTISGGEKVDITGARSLTIGAGHTIITPMNLETSTKSTLSETVGAAYIQAAGQAVPINVAGSLSVSVGAVKVEAVAEGKEDKTIGARASTIGGALLNITGKDVITETSSGRATTVGGAWLSTAAADADFTTAGDLSIKVGGAVVITGATIKLTVGGSSVTLAGGAVILDSSEIKLTASGPNAELAPLVGSK